MLMLVIIASVVLATATASAVYVLSSQSLVSPSLSLVVYNESGKQVWAYEPPRITWPNNTVIDGQEFGGSTCIATCGGGFPLKNLQPGRYTMYAEPLFYSYPDDKYLGDNLQIAANFTVH